MPADIKRGVHRQRQWLDEAKPRGRPAPGANPSAAPTTDPCPKHARGTPYPKPCTRSARFAGRGRGGAHHVLLHVVARVLRRRREPRNERHGPHHGGIRIIIMSATGSGGAARRRSADLDLMLTRMGLIAPPMSLTAVDIARRPVAAEARRTVAERAAAAMVVDDRGWDSDGRREGEKKNFGSAHCSVNLTEPEFRKTSPTVGSARLANPSKAAGQAGTITAVQCQGRSAQRGICWRGVEAGRADAASGYREGSTTRKIAAATAGRAPQVPKTDA